MDLLLSTCPFYAEFTGGSELRSNIQSSEPHRIKHTGRLVRAPLSSTKLESYTLCMDSVPEEWHHTSWKLRSLKQAKCNSTFFRRDDLSRLYFHSSVQCGSGLYYLMLTFVLGWQQLGYNIGAQYITEFGMACFLKYVQNCLRQSYLKEKVLSCCGSFIYSDVCELVHL